MGTIKTTNIQSISGSGTVTLGTSGETFTVPSGVTIANSGTATGFGGNNQPYFTAYQTGNYSLAQNTATTIVLGNTTVNSGTAYNTSTGKFTPQVAGDYLVTAFHNCRHGSSGNAVVLFESYIQKNGSNTNFRASTGNEATNTLSQSMSSMGGIITMNGSSDYLTLSVTQYDYTAGASQNISEIQFMAFKII